MKPKRNKKIRTFVDFVQLRGELNHASLKPYLPNDPHESLKCLFIGAQRHEERTKIIIGNFACLAPWREHIAVVQKEVGCARKTLTQFEEFIDAHT
jgi:hypothetical protein